MGNGRGIWSLCAVALVGGGLAVVPGSPGGAGAPPPTEDPGPLGEVRFELAGRFDTGGGAGTAEISAFEDGLLYVTDGPAIDVVDIADPAAPQVVESLAVGGPGLAEPTSVAVHRGLVAVTVPAEPKTDPGVVQFFRDGRKVGQLHVGALPDMVTFTPSGLHVLVANEGEPNSYDQPDSVDPVGSVSVVPAIPYFFDGGAQRLLARFFPARTAGFEQFDADGRRHRELPEGVRIFGPGASVSQDLEPEYVTTDGFTAWVTLQENNAVAEIDVLRARVRRIVALGTKDHSAPGNGLDPSDRDGGVAIGTWPVQGMYMPDAVASYRSGRATYLVTANEGDARDYDGFSEESRARDFADLDAIPAAGDNAQLGRLTVTTATPAPADGSELYAFGGRSFSIFSTTGELVFDSGDDVEQITAATNPDLFNADNEEDNFDNRSDNKGPEPEGVTVGRIGRRTYAFVALERVGGTMVYDVTDPRAPVFQQYLTTRVFDGSVGPDSGPEAVVFIPAGESPTGRAMIAVSHEISGTVSLWEAAPADGGGTLTLLHNNDGESTLLPLVAPGGVNTAGVSAYKSVLDREIAAARAEGNAVLNVYAGDAFLASAALACSLPPNPPHTPVFDAVAQRQMTYDVHVFGNHEFDFTPDYLERFVRGFDHDGVPVEPFLSANLDFSAEPGFADLLDSDGVIVREAAGGRVVARAAIVVDEATGLRFGVVGATTPTLPTISSPRNVALTSTDLASTAEVVQTEVDALAARGITKVVLVSHLQNVDNDVELVGLLHGVDVAVAGGGDELLANADTPLLPGSPAPAGPYPLEGSDADGTTVPIVTTAGNYKYAGRIDLTFDDAGELVGVDAASSYPRRVVVADEAAEAAGITDAVEPDPLVDSTAIEPVEACLAGLAEPIARSEVPINVSHSGNASLGFTTGVRSGETNGGDLVTDAFLASYDAHAVTAGLPARGPGNPVVAVQNGGGIRQNAGDVLPVGGAVPGPITRQNTLDVLAFLTNTITVVEDVTPAELEPILERSASQVGGGQFLQVAGISVAYDLTGVAQQVSPPPPGEQAGDVVTPGSRVVSATLADGTALIAGGEPVAGAPSIRLVTNSFTAGGGDNYPAFEDTPTADKVNLGLTYEQALVEYLLSFPVADGLPTVPETDSRYAAPTGDGRITFLP